MSSSLPGATSASWSGKLITELIKRDRLIGNGTVPRSRSDSLGWRKLRVFAPLWDTLFLLFTLMAARCKFPAKTQRRKEQTA